jgi:hypothetical protein
VCFSKLGETTQLSVSKHKLTTYFLQIEVGGGEEMGELGSSTTSTFFSQTTGLATMVEEETSESEETTSIFFSTVVSTFCSTVCKL